MNDPSPRPCSHSSHRLTSLHRPYDWFLIDIARCAHMFDTEPDYFPETKTGRGGPPGRGGRGGGGPGRGAPRGGAKMGP